MLTWGTEEVRSKAKSKGGTHQDRKRQGLTSLIQKQVSVTPSINSNSDRCLYREGSQTPGQVVPKGTQPASSHTGGLTDSPTGLLWLDLHPGYRKLPAPCQVIPEKDSSEWQTAHHPGAEIHPGENP